MLGGVEHPKSKGDRSTLAIMFALRELGYSLLVPFGENTRYDLVIDDGRSLARVQCKSGRLRNGSVKFKTSSSYAHHPHPKITKRDYLGEVEFFAVYCHDNGCVYLIPIDDLRTRSEAILRIEPCRNGQLQGIRYAASYEIARLPTATVSARRAPGGRAGGSGSSA